MIIFFELLHSLYKQTFSRVFGPRCRFFPFCSDYCLECLKEHGIIKGMKPALKRIFSCHPLNPGGYDPVPSKINKKNTIFY